VYVAGIVMRMTAVNAFVTVLGVITGPLLARALGPAGRGTLAAIVVPLALAPWIASLGLPSYATRSAARGEPLGALVGSVGTLAVIVGAVAAAVGVPTAAVLAHGRNVVHTFLLIGFSLLPIAGLGSLLFAIGTGLERWRLVVAARVTPFLLGAIGIVILFISHQLTVATAATVTLISGISAVIPLLTLLRQSGRLRFRLAVARESLVFGSKAWIGNLSALTNYRLDQLLMIVLVDARQLGLYVVAVTVSGISQVLTGALTAVLPPMVAQGDRRLPRQALRTTLAAVVAVNAALAVLTPWLLPLIFGSAFRDAIAMTWILLLAVLPSHGSFVLDAVLTAAGRPGASAVGQLLSAAITLPGLLALLPPLGGNGAALVTLLAYSANFAFLLVISRRHFGGSVHDFLWIRRRDISWGIELLKLLLHRSSPRTG
jgi:O-antigen/teichoic acid export membrane protein